MDVRGERAALKHVAAAPPPNTKTTTPTMLMPLKGPNDVPSRRSRQFFIARKDVARRPFSCAIPRRPRLSEVKPTSIPSNRWHRLWYEKQFPTPRGRGDHFQP